MKINDICLFWITFFGITFPGFFASESDTLPGHLIDGDIMIEDDYDPWDRSYGPLVDMRLKRWPERIIPFDINETVYSIWDLHVIHESLKEIEKWTCVKFQKRRNEKDYIYISPLGGCWSYVGRKGSEQVLSLVVPHCINKGTIIHEFLHALGLWHEHSRSDRDDYIEILWGNVMNEEKQANFAKHFPEALNFQSFPYDYQSIMHYDAYAFSKSPKIPTMKPKQPNVRLRDLGRAKAIGTLTEIDKRKINSLYECK
ncbi:zinc metalloproteinase nas-14 [Trichonephila inaurata madagascariensis]|uniref:Metalloendopeptidase n=1 Tax=Trichonephila inaurata madagascariensis TaxID=2747483 RepID=A0A8X6YL33_9ARAC|nr:zinc metalloproteinase nas-14 [Trichonephila inaurata madagascariensis]